jgi:hypothetical protein
MVQINQRNVENFLSVGVHRNISSMVDGQSVRFVEGLEFTS